jgi:hypothetical protein
MSRQVQIRRGTTAEHAAFTGAVGELSYNTTTKRLHTHDGSTVGGAVHALLAEMQSADTAVGDAAAAALAARVATLAGAGGAATVGTSDGSTVQGQLNGALLASDLNGDGNTDNTLLLNTWIDRAMAGNRVLLLPAGSFVFSDTLLIDSTIEIRGAGRDRTNLIFNNATAGKSAIKLVRNSSKSRFSSFTLGDGTFGTSCGIELTDSISGSGTNVAKNTFDNIEVVGFAVGHKYTSTTPLTGSGHAMCSENLWVHCRFVINILTCLNENCQAFNNGYVHCDFENFNTTYRGTTVVDSYDFFSDVAGGGIYIEGGSIVGRGKVYKWAYPATGTGLWNGGSFTWQNSRFEARSTHNGAVINEEVSGVTGSLTLNVDIKNIEVVTFSQTIDFLRYGGRLNARIERVFPTAGTGTLNVRQYPTLGRTSNTTTASQGAVELYDSTLYRVLDTTSPHGTYNRNATGKLTAVGMGSSSTGTGMVLETTGATTWFALAGPGDAQQLGMQLQSISTATRLVWNNDNPSSGVTGDVYVKLPAGGRPMKLVAFKHATNFATNTGFLLYLVKDQANWAVPGTFAKATDATLVASMPSTLNLAGYFEANCQLTANILGNEIRSGFGSWTEGRMYFEKVGGATAFNGWFGVEYL